MKRKRHSPEQIIARLREADAPQGGGVYGAGDIGSVGASGVPGIGPAAIEPALSSADS